MFAHNPLADALRGDYLTEWAAAFDRLCRAADDLLLPQTPMGRLVAEIEVRRAAIDLWEVQREWTDLTDTSAPLQPTMARLYYLALEYARLHARGVDEPAPLLAAARDDATEFRRRMTASE